MKSARSSLALAAALLAFSGAAASAAGAASPASAASAVTPGGTQAPSEPSSAPSSPSSGPGEPTSAPSTSGTPSQQPASSGSTAPPISRLSNELTLTVWAHPEGTGRIYLHPSTRASRVAKIHLYDADGFPEVYLLLSSYVDSEGREWVEVRVPGRPNGRTGWMLRELLGSFHRTHWRIVVNRAERRMRVYYDGRLLRVFPVGVGKPSTPTPAGHFWIDERFKLTNPSSPYWPYALGTSDFSTLPNWPGEGVVGIHGPYGEPEKIPGDPSHGCIRMLDPDIAWLGPRVTLGTPVDII
jgi:L,D-transpeptidase catalytic domain